MGLGQDREGWENGIQYSPQNVYMVLLWFVLWDIDIYFLPQEINITDCIWYILCEHALLKDMKLD